MSEIVYYPSDVKAFESVVQDITSVVISSARLPQWPFRSSGFAHFCTYDEALEGSFSRPLQALVDSHGDETVSFVVLDPTPQYYREYYTSYPVFRVPAQGIEETHWEHVSFWQGGLATGAPIHTADVFAITGSSKRWVVWGQRAWDMGIVLSDEEHGGWEHAGVEFVSGEDALQDWTEPALGPLAEAVRDTFTKSLRERGSGIQASIGQIDG